MFERIKYFSDWHRVRKAIAIYLLFIERMKLRVKKDKDPSVQHDDKDPQHQNSGRKQHDKLSRRILVTVEDLQKVELLLIKAVQCRAFPAEMKTLEAKQQRSDMNGKVKKVTKRSSPIHRLDPFLDKDVILRVGGRLFEAGVPCCQRDQTRQT